MTQLDCLEPILDQHASRYAWAIRMLDLHLRQMITSGEAFSVNADDCHAYLPKLNLPPDADTRFLAAVWRRPGWIHAGYVRSNRCQNHHRVISSWRLK